MELSTVDHLPSELTSTVTGSGLRHLADDTPGRESVFAEWRLEAACRGMDTALFYPECHERHPDEVKEACARCTVAAECLAFALENGEVYGMWGGLPVRQRRKIRRQRREEGSAA